MYDTKKLVFTHTGALVLALVGCGNEEQAQNDTSTTNESTQSSSNQTDEGAHPELTVTEAVDGTQEFTPIVAEVPDAPIPFAGSDGLTHLVYEQETTNFTSC